MAAIPSPGDGSNLVSNGGFEDTSPRGTSIAPAGNFTLLAGNPDLCYWSVGRYAQNREELSRVVVTSPLSQPGWEAQQGSNSLLLGGNGLQTDVTVTQIIRTTPGSKYSLSFYLAGYPQPCQNETLRLQLSPSSNSSAFITDSLFYSEADINVEWMQISLDFIAETEATNLTFVNEMRAGICAPVIDKVSVVKVKKQRKGKVAAITISVAVTIVVVGVILFLKIRKRRTDEAKTMAAIPASRGKKGSDENNVGQRVHIRTYAMWEVMEATDNFSNKVGEGGFGAVYRANLGGDRIGAVKRATKRGIHNPQIFKEELSVLLRLNHPNLVNLIGLCFEQGEQILIFEFVPNGSLRDRLHAVSEQTKTTTPLTWASRMSIAHQIGVALQYLHEQAEPPVFHHDVKSSNVLLVDDNHAKLADFGLSKLGLRDNHGAPAPVKGSYGYTDPQYIKTGKPTMKSDVYSFGVLLLELITGLKAVKDFETLAQWSEEYRLSQDMRVVSTIVDPVLQGKVDLEELEVIIDIVNMCLREEGESRPSMGVIVRALSYKDPISSEIISDGDGEGEEWLNRSYRPPSSNSYATDNDSASV